MKKIQAIAHSYWRRIKAGARTFESLSDESYKDYPTMKEQVRHLAKTDVVNGEIMQEEYENFIGEKYVAEAAE